MRRLQLLLLLPFVVPLLNGPGVLFNCAPWALCDPFQRGMHAWLRADSANYVAVHCKSGRGRSAAIAMGWLIQVKKLSPLQANEHLLKVRKVRGKLFMQTNIINFYEDLQKQAHEASLRPEERTVSSFVEISRQTAGSVTISHNCVHALHDANKRSPI